jgi:hypothetical protein
MHPVQISCITSNWRGVVVRALNEIHEINLVHFLLATDVEFCQDIAAKYSMGFTARPKKHVAYFRKRASPRPAR